ARKRAEEEEEKRERDALAVGERHGFEPAVLTVQACDLAAITYHDSVAVELANEIVGHRLAQVGAAVGQRDQRAPPCEPNCRLAGRVAAADDAHTRCAAQLALRRPGGIEDAQSLEFLEAVDWRTPVLGAGREQDRAGRDLVVLLQLDEIAAVALRERQCAVR